MSSLGKRLFLKIVSKLVPDSATEVRMRVDRVDINWQSLLVAALFWPFQQSLFLPARRDPTLDTPGQMGKVTDGGRPSPAQRFPAQAKITVTWGYGLGFVTPFLAS